MKKTVLTRILGMVLMIIFLLSSLAMIAMAAHAAETTGDGIEVTLTTDKDAYGADEAITVTLTAKNTNSFAVSDVSLKSYIPEGYELADGDQATKQQQSLAAGESVSLVLRLVTAQAAEPTPPADIPATEDNAYTILWLVLMLISGGGLAILAVKNRSWKRYLSMMLVLAILATMGPALPIRSGAEETDAKTINISTTVKVADEDVAISASVAYALPGSGNSQTHTVRFILNYEGAPQIAAQQVAHGSCAVQPEGLEREGYILAYWFEYDVDSVTIFDLSQPVTEDTTLYAYWIEDDGSSAVTFSTFYKVSFGYPDSMTEEDRTAVYLPEEKLVYENALVYSLDEPIMEDYVFAAWFYDSAMTQMADVEDVITKDTVLYPLMVKSAANTEGMPTNNYVAALDVTDLNYSVTVKAPSLQAVKDGLIWLDISRGGQLMDIVVTDNGDGTYIVRTAEKLEPGKTYQLRVQDREQIPATGLLVNALDSYIRFYHNGELQSLDVEYYNIFTSAQEIDNLKLSSGIVLIPIGQVSGIDLEEAVSLISLMPDENGEMSMTKNEQNGSFTYTGDKLLKAGDVVLVYEGDISAVEAEYAVSGTVGAATNSTFVKIASIQGDTYYYGTPDLNEVLFMPDVLPVHVAEDTDGNSEDNTVTIADSCLDFSMLPVESTALNENTVAEPGDFIAFYDGTLEEPGSIRYAKILTLESKDGFTTITFEAATMEDIQTSIDSYIRIETDVELTEQEQILLKNKVVQQALDSGFAGEAAALAVQQKLGLEEEVVWGQQYRMTRLMAQALSADLGAEVDIEDFEIDAGIFLIELQMDPPDVNANITSNLQRITTINNGKGIRVAFGVYIPVGIEIVNAFTNEVDQSLKMDLYVTMEQEFAFDIIMKADYGIDFEWIIWESDAWLEMDIIFDIGTYTGVGAVIMVDTEKNYEKSYLWDELVKNDGSGGAFTSAESLADQLDKIFSEGDSSFFNQYKDEKGNSTLIDEYRQMLQNDVDYIDILAIPLVKYKNKITPTTPIGDYKLSLELVFAAKVNVVMGTSFQTMNVKRYSFSIRASVQDGVNVWANPVVDKQTPYHSLNLMLMGNIGLRAGFRFTGQIGLLDVRIANVGIMVEIGAYVDLYGFGYFHYDWSESGTTNSQQAGALYVDIGMYMDIDLSLNALMDFVTATFHVLEMEVSFFRLGTRQYLVDVKPRELTVTVSQKNRYDTNYFTLGSDAYRIQYVDIVSGEISYRIGHPNNFVFQIPAEYEDKIVYQRTDSSGKVKHQFYIKSTVDELELEIPIRIVYKDSMRVARANSLDSIYDLIGEAAGTKTIQWSRGKSSYSISYYTGIPYNYYDENGKLGSGGEYITVAQISEMTPIPSISINDRAPEVPGMNFAGWQVTSYDDEHSLSGMIIQDLTDLAGQEMISGRIYLHAVYTPRNDTKYTVRHLVPSLTDPDDYEVFAQEEYTGTTHSGVDPQDYILTNTPGLSMDYGKLPFTSFETYEIDGEEYLFYSFRHSIRNDGGTVIDIYYKRNSCRVTVFANNPLYVYYGSTTSSGVTSLVKYGEAVTDPGYADAQIPGFTFLGWSTTKDGSSGIMDSLPDSLDFTTEQSKTGVAYYAIWKSEQVDCTIHYYLQDPQGEYQFLGTETQKVSCGTPLVGYALTPENIQLPRITYGGHIEAYTDTPYVADYITYNTTGYVIHVYYDQSYYKVVFDRDAQYYLLGDTVTFPSAEKEGYIFQGWESWYVGDTNLYLPGDTFKVTTTPYYFYPVFTEADDVKYTVKHYLEKVNGTYADEADVTETFFDGTTDGTVSPEVKVYTGFDSPVKQTVTVAADGSTVVEYFYKRTTYNVSVDAQVDGESLILRGQHTLSYKYGVPFYLSDAGYNPITINRTGYELVGWYWADDPSKTLLDNFWVDGDALTSGKDLVFKPLWKKSICSYTVMHYVEQLDGSYALLKTEICEGEYQAYVTAQDAVLSGFTFNESDANNVLSGQIALDGSLTLELYYTRNSYEAKWYNYDGTTLMASTQFQFGEEITAPEISANRMGYTFSGWNTGNATMPVGGVSFNAKDHGVWTPNTYTVRFHANGGTGTMATQTMTYDMIETLTANAFTYAGYAFAGWSTTAGGEVEYSDQAQVCNLATSGSVALYAQWTIGASAAYKVEFYGETLNGTGYEVIKTENHTGVVGTAATASAASILGFTYDASNSGNILSGEIAADGTLVLKLYYTRNSYTLTLDFNGESMKQAVRNEETWQMEIRSFDVANITYSWKYGQTISLADFDAITMTVKTGEQVYDESTAQWVDEMKEVSYKEAFAGYIFQGWDGLCDTMPANDLTLTAQWTPITVTITLKPGYNQSGYGDSNAPTGDPMTITAFYGETIAIPTDHKFVCDGYFILGWNHDNKSVGAEIVDELVLLDGYYCYSEALIVSDGAEELTPYWENNNNQCKVTFDSNGGNGVMDAQLVTNASGIIVAIKRNLFTREGYRFVGWLAPDGNIHEDGAMISFTGTETKLIAQWEKIEE